MSQNDSHCLNLSWCYGLSTTVSVLNLTTDRCAVVLYSCAQSAVLYNINDETQSILQGHRNVVTCTASSNDRRWVVTADLASESAEECSVIIWDLLPYLENSFTKPIPIQVESLVRKKDATMGVSRGLLPPSFRLAATDFENIVLWSNRGFGLEILRDNLFGGCVSVDISNDNKYIVTLSAPYQSNTSSPQGEPASSPVSGTSQWLSLWEWCLDEQRPIHSLQLENISFMQPLNQVKFNSADQSQIVCTGAENVVFLIWNVTSIRHSIQTVTGEDFNKAVGQFTVSQFVPTTDRVLTLTTEGNIIVWCDCSPENAASQEMKHILKLYKHQESTSLTAIQIISNYVAIGNSVGEVTFMDRDLKLTQWKEKVASGPIISISFSNTNTSQRIIPEDLNPKETTIIQSNFSVPDFIVGTSSSQLVHITGDGHSIDVLKDEHDSFLCAMSCHPTQNIIAMGGHTGKLKVWDYIEHKVISKVCFSIDQMIFCLNYDATGGFLAAGFTNGDICVLDSLTLQIVCGPLRYSHDCITSIVFSPDNRYLTTSDADCCVVLYEGKSVKFSIEGDKQNDASWQYQYLGKYRSHYKPIVDLKFFIDTTSSIKNPRTRLFSLGWDQMLIEYDLENSIENDLKLLGTHRLEQMASPTCFIQYPPLSKESFFLLANNSFKMKLFNTTTKLCRKTLLGPAYGDPIQRMQLLPAPIIYSDNEDQIRRYLAYITHDKIGITVLPMTGNPYHHMATIAHPGQVVNLAVSNDGKFVFTAGGEDCSVLQWRVNTGICDAQIRLSNAGMQPFYELIEGGRDGSFYKQIEEFFYYSQIKSEGVETTEKRQIYAMAPEQIYHHQEKVSMKIPLDQIANVMRALGYFPTEHEIKTMLDEIKFSEYVDSHEYVTNIDLEAFIKLYINHRPAYGVHPYHVYEAFSTLSEHDGTLHRADLLQLLGNSGEKMNENELADCLSTILGITSDDDPDLTDPVNTIQDESFNLNLPENLTAEMLAEKLLGYS